MREIDVSSSNQEKPEAGPRAEAVHFLLCISTSLFYSFNLTFIQSHILSAVYFCGEGHERLHIQGVDTKHPIKWHSPTPLRFFRALWNKRI